MRLCRICNLANCSAFAEGECSICKGKALATEGMAEKAASLLKEADAGSFSISTIIPKDWLVREERAFDEHISAKTESIKNRLNRMVVSEIAEKTGCRYDTDGDVRLVFDYSSGNVTIQRNDLFIFGRYKKLVSGLSQSRWICPKCMGTGCAACEGKGKYYVSVEERIGEPLKAASCAEDYVLHASGREDVDATNSAGRPFVFEMKNPEKRALDLPEIAGKIAESGEVSVSDLCRVGRGFVEIVTESHFDKEYTADVEFEKEIDTIALSKIRELEGKTLIQQTPKRVVHRRADLVRHRKIKKIEILWNQGSSARITVRAEAGTYIKELISGDDGRTRPNVSEILGTKAVCRALDVAAIDDGYLDFVLSTWKHNQKK